MNRVFLRVTSGPDIHFLINPDRNFESSDDEEYEYDETDKEIDIAEGRHMECNDE